MTLAEFKSAYGITAINLYQSKSSNRLVGSFHHKGAEQRICTTESFNGSKPVFVYPTEVTDEDTGEISTIYVLSNKQATPKLVL